jgi:hypothetical protein
MRRCRLVAIRNLSMALAVAANWSAPTQAHDIYHSLKNKAGESCCNDADCRPTFYRVTSHGVRMYVNGRWIDVPNDVIQYRSLPGDTGETAGGHWCGPFTSGGGQTRCAVLPPNSALLSLR